MPRVNSRPVSVLALTLALAAPFSTASADPVARRTHAGTPAPTSAVVRPSSRYLVTVGAFHVRAAERDAAIAELARQTLLEQLSTRDEVTVSEQALPSAQLLAVIRRNHLRGFHFDGSIQLVPSGTDALRVECSLLIQTSPGREYRFESSVTLTATGLALGAPADERTPHEDALVRRAVQSATMRALAQLPSTR